jgi:hypothetical protein
MKADYMTRTPRMPTAPAAAPMDVEYIVGEYFREVLGTVRVDDDTFLHQGHAKELLRRLSAADGRAGTGVMVCRECGGEMPECPHCGTPFHSVGYPYIADGRAGMEPIDMTGPFLTTLRSIGDQAETMKQTCETISRFVSTLTDHIAAAQEGPTDGD